MFPGHFWSSVLNGNRICRIYKVFEWVVKKRCKFFFGLFLKVVGQISIEDSFFKENIYLRFQ
ncbi:hypothetical protein IQ66_03465 [Leptospira borgpetersenii serovar Ballum]|nr:hypothetical protein IQ66_03465 [Leptospira borgpetersenii serovar Ballum]